MRICCLHWKLLTIAMGIGLFIPQQVFPACEILGGVYRGDVDFPEHWPFWGGTVRPLGGSVHVLLRNTGEQAVAINDVLLEGISLSEAIAYSNQKRKGFIYAASIHFSTLSAAEMDTLIQAGEPVWWKAAPPEIAPGDSAEVMIRLRYAPQVGTLHIGIPVGGETLSTDVPVVHEIPRIESISFSPERDKVYLYFHHPQGGTAIPDRIFMDGREVTARTRIEQDPNVSIVPAVVTLDGPLLAASFHSFSAEYSDGSQARAGLRTFSGELWYGMCGAKPGDETDFDLARRYLQELHDHNINVQLPTLGSSAVREFLKTDEGQDLCETLGLRLMPNAPGKWTTRDPIAFYLVDEPDAGEYSLVDLEWDQKVGTLARGLLEYTESYREADPDTPHLVNVDMTFKPFNWYTYGLLPDVFCADPYYQVRLTTAYWNRPEEIPLYEKATYITAVGEVCRSACAPQPLFLLLRATSCYNDETGFTRWATPVEKRIEVFYSLAAGAKGVGYWWYTTPGGCGSSDPGAVALWTEIGVLGLEIRTAGPAIVRSCPAQLAIESPEEVWLRSLLVGTDTVLLLCVNDDYLCDDQGTTITPVDNARISVTVPSWLEPIDVFQVHSGGIGLADWDFSDGNVDIDVGTLEVSRLFVVTSDTQLRQQMGHIYSDLSGQTLGGYWLVD
jgi:hypothetical protein